MSDRKTHVSTAIVVPCYNEERRLHVDAFEAFLTAHPYIQFIFVDDGSTDGTSGILRAFQKSHPHAIEVFMLPRNVGKAEAVRQGFLAALKTSPSFVGFWDADLSTPLGEIPSFVGILENMPETEMVFGARVQLLGRSIRRRRTRHYLGRVFATMVAAILHLPIYDTQCGAKVFRANDHLRAAIATPFVTRWIFDVELIARYIKTVGGSRVMAERIYELPLEKWEDVAGSKVHMGDFAKAPWELWKIWWIYLR